MNVGAYPEAKIARPPVHLWAISAVHSDLDVGFESGKMIGGLGDWFMAVRTSSERKFGHQGWFVESDQLRVISTWTRPCKDYAEL